MTFVDPNASPPEAMADLTGLLHASRWSVDIDYWVYRFRNDNLLALELAVCEKYHLPHSAFLEWDEVDRAKALAYQIHESRRCGQCGIHPEDWPEDAPVDDPPFEADAKVCPGCEEMARYQRWLRGQAKDDEAKLDGVTPYLKRRR